MPRISNCLGRAVLCAGLVVAALGSRVARAEDAVLLASTVPGYVPGMVVSSADRLSLPEGASATLLFQSGATLRLRGPFEGTLAQQQPATGAGDAAMFADMFRMHGVDATVIGGTRSTGSTQSGPTLDDVLVDPERSGTYCVESATSVWIARPSGETGVYALRRKGSSRTLGWPAGAERIEWPADVPIEDGSQFEITPGGAARATVTFRGVPSNLPNGPARIAAGLVLGCHDQFDAELKRLSRSIAGPEVWITTDRGRHPEYRPGEPIAVTVTASEDGYLYCIATDDDGSAKPIFPAGAVDGAQLRGSAPLSIPGRRQPNGLTAAAVSQRIRCWLADRDITPELPHALLGATSARLPDQLATDLDALFGRIGGTRIEADQLTIKTAQAPATTARKE
nr:DUF4384 domain-containing protein [uncultured Rhodopila sp.]